MIGFQNQVPLKSLTCRASLVMLLRTLYRMGLNYCVLPPTGEYAYAIVFTKDQLVSLIERSNSEMFIAEIPKHVIQGLFKPVAIFKSDSSSSDFVSNGGFAEPERLQVLIIEEDGAKVSSLKEALAPRMPDFPEWWEAPVPFAMCGYGKLHINRTALLMFGPDLKRMSIGDIPDKNEFLVILEGGASHCSVTFRRLEGDIFVLEDSTSDITTAEEVAWWAAVGKAWTAALDLEKRAYRRCDEEEAEYLRSEKTLVHPCEWGGELLGYFCVDNKAGAGVSRPKEQASASRSSLAEKSSLKKADKPKKDTPKNKRQRKDAAKKTGKKGEKNDEKSATAANDTLNILGAQTLGLLAPGMSFPIDTSESKEYAEMESEQKNERPEKLKKPKKKSAKKNKAQGNV